MDVNEYEHVEVSKGRRHRKKKLYNSILHLMEFYFSDSNLTKDRFLSQLLRENEYIDLNVFLKFNKIRKLTNDKEDIRKAIRKSELFEFSEDKEKIKRRIPVKIKENVDNCTIYVENIAADADHDWVSHIFSDFGNVVYVSIPKYKHNKANKGFAFVEFETEEGAKNAVTYFENIGCKIPSEATPDKLKSVLTFEGNDPANIIEEEVTQEKQENNIHKIEDDEHVNKVKVDKVDESNEEKVTENKDENSKKRKVEEDDQSNKKMKVDESKIEEVEETNVELKKELEVDDNESKKKKKHKKDKKKSLIKELGIQVLSKLEWKKMRNKYLDLQRKKMKDFKQYLYRQKFVQKNKKNVENAQIKSENVEDVVPKLEFIPGVIVKVNLPEPALDVRKLKNDIKALSSDIKYVDIPFPSGSDEIFVRFSNNKDAEEFCSKDFPGSKAVLKDEEEQMYWDKIQADRGNKFSKNIKKQRGRDKLLKKAEKERVKHIKFDDGGD